MKIQVHNKIKLLPLSQSELINIAQWLCNSIEIPVITLDIIFTDDESLRELHEQYLNDSEYTDVMTFNLGTSDAIEGEIYISNDRASENASTYKVPLENEICRLMTHACLHLAGYQDNNDLNRLQMKKKEEKFLSMVLKKFIN